MNSQQLIEQVSGLNSLEKVTYEPPWGRAF